jgi:hypothetical protein
MNLIPNLIRFRGSLTPVGRWNALRIILAKSGGYPRPTRRGPLANDSWFYRPSRRPDPSTCPLFADDILLKH